MSFVGPMPPFHVYRGFLDGETHAELLDWTLAHEDEFGQGLLGGHRYDPRVRVAETLSLLPPSPWFDRLAPRIHALLPDLLARTGVRPFDIAGTELELAAHRDGAYFRPHLDTVTGARRADTDRILSGVYYFHREPKGFSGGQLRLIRFGAKGEDEADHVEVEPDQNSLVFFPSWAQHEVRPVTVPSRRFEDSRFAVNCWLRAKRG